jgi:hypothetical protein
MKKNMIFFFVLALISACHLDKDKSKEGAAPIQFVKYYVRYVEEIKEVQTELKFYRDQDTSLILPVLVQCNKEKMYPKKLSSEGWIYKWIKRPIDVKSQFVFQYGSDSSQMIQDTINFLYLDSLILSTPQISKKNGGLLTWKGSTLQSEDQLTILFEDTNGNHFTVNHVGITRGPQLEIRPEHVESLLVGKSTIRLVHKNNEVDKVGDKKFSKTTEFYYKPIEAQIIP